MICKCVQIQVIVTYEKKKEEKIVLADVRRLLSNTICEA